MAIHVGSKGDFGKGASNVKFVIENPEDPDSDPSTQMSASTAKNDKTQLCKCTKKHKRFLGR